MDTSAIDQVVEEMSAPLRRKLEAVRELLAAATADEVRGRHGVGVLILEVKTDENRYGKGAVAKLANSIGVDATTLYRYAAVAKVWDAPTVRSLLRRKGPHGQPASWCHLMELVRVPSASCRKKLLERVLVEGLSVRALVGLVREAGGEHEADDAETESGSAGIVRDLAKLARIAQTYTTRSSGVEETLLRVEGLAHDASGEVTKLLHQVVQAQQEAQEIGNRVLARLRAAESTLIDSHHDGRPRRPAPPKTGAGSDSRVFVPHLLAGGE